MLRWISFFFHTASFLYHSLRHTHTPSFFLPSFSLFLVFPFLLQWLLSPFLRRVLASLICPTSDTRLSPTVVQSSPSWCVVSYPSSRQQSRSSQANTRVLSRRIGCWQDYFYQYTLYNFHQVIQEPCKAP